MFSRADGDSVAKLSERICMWINPQRSRRKTVFCNLWFVIKKKRIMKRTGPRGAGEGSASSVMLCKCMCAYNWEPVRVVDRDGRVRSLNHPVTVGELVECHPHHFVCEPTSKAPLYHTAMLPLDMKLEEGRIYLLLPLPRLLPHLSNIFDSEPPSCPCFQSLHPQLAAAAAVHNIAVTPTAAAATQALVLNPSKTKEAAGSLIHAAAAATSQDDIPDPDPSKIGTCSIDKTMTTSSNSAAGAQLRATTRISEWFNVSKSNVGGSDVQDCKNHLRLQAARLSTEQTSDHHHPLGAQQQQQQEAAKQARCFMSPMLMASLVHLVKKLLSSLIIPFSTNVQEPGGARGAGRDLELKVAAAGGFHQCSMRNRWRPALECISELDSQFAAAAGMMLSNEPDWIITAPSRSLCWGLNFCFFQRDHRTWTLQHMYGDISRNWKFINHHIILT